MSKLQPNRNVKTSAQQKCQNFSKTEMSKLQQNRNFKTEIKQEKKSGKTEMSKVELPIY